MKMKKKNVFWLVIIECLVLTGIFVFFMMNDNQNQKKITLDAKKYTVGVDIEAGVYNLKVNSEETFGASVNVLNKLFIFMDKNVPSYDNLNLVDGDSFEVFFDKAKNVDFIKKNKFKLNGYSDVVLNQGTYVVGRDLTEGKYFLEVENIKSAVASIVINNKDMIELHSEKLKSDNIELKKGDILDISLSTNNKVSLKKAN